MRVELGVKVTQEVGSNLVTGGGQNGGERWMVEAEVRHAAERMKRSWTLERVRHMRVRFTLSIAIGVFSFRCGAVLLLLDRKGVIRLPELDRH